MMQCLSVVVWWRAAVAACGRSSSVAVHSACDSHWLVWFLCHGERSCDRQRWHDCSSSSSAESAHWCTTDAGLISLPDVASCTLRTQRVSVRATVVSLATRTQGRLSLDADGIYWETSADWFSGTDAPKLIDFMFYLLVGCGEVMYMLFL